MSRYSLLIVVILAALVSTARAQGEDNDGWKQVVKTDDLIVEMRKAEGTNVHSVRCSGYVKASVAAIENCLRDLDTMKKIVFRFDTVEYINEPALGMVCSDDIHYVYGMLDAPWPVMDRDCVAVFKFWIDAKTGDVLCECTSQKTDYRLDKEAKKRIRVNICYGKFTLIHKGKDLTYAMAEGLGDPEGAIPASVINLFSRYGVIYTFKQFQKAATSEKYNNPSAKLITTTVLSEDEPSLK
ncbi:MAG: hypothetical protein ABFD81_16150 [Syntrophaceae bacterium]